MKCSASCYLALALLFGGLFAYFDAVFYKLLVIEYQVLFQSCVGYIATIGSFLHRDVAVVTQKSHRLCILFLSPRAYATGKAVIQPQPLPCPFAELQHFGIVRA